MFPDRCPCILRCKKNLEGWSLPGFKAEALKVYTGVCTALAAGNQNTLRQVGIPADPHHWAPKPTISGNNAT